MDELASVKTNVTIERPLPVYALPRVWNWTRESRRQVADDFAVQTLDAFVSQWEAAERAGRSSWGVWRDGELGGAVTSTPISPVCAVVHCIFKRSFWGHATTLPAVEAVLGELFGDGVLKITATAFHDNHALLGLMRKLGFHKEGVLKRQTRRNGQMIDVVMMGLTVEDFAQCAPERARVAQTSPNESTSLAAEASNVPGKAGAPGAQAPECG